MTETEGVYLVGQDVSDCKCGKGDYTVKNYFLKTTKYIEKKISEWRDTTWICEQCECSWVLEYHLRENSEMNFCPGCGRKITEFVDYVEEEEE